MNASEIKRIQLQNERFAMYQKYAQTVNDFEAYKKANPRNLEKMTQIYISEIETLQAKMASLQQQINNTK